MSRLYRKHDIDCCWRGFNWPADSACHEENFLEATENNKQTNLEENRIKIDDLVPKGRDENQLDFTMDWVRRNDKYGASQKTGSKR